MVKPHPKVSYYGFFPNNDNDSIMKSNQCFPPSSEGEENRALSFYRMFLMNCALDFDCI